MDWGIPRMIYKVFKTRNNKYLYDRQENRIAKIDEDDYACFLDLENGIENEKSKDVLERYRKHGLCKDNELQEIEHPSSRDLRFYLEEHIENLTLQVTQDCNLRCSYCTYSGKYNNRSHAKKKISYETACKAIDFYIRHSRRSGKRNIGFYGGEPLLEIKLIKKIMSYVEENYEGKAIKYSMTTNATLLSDNIVDFLVEKNVSLMISIDGPKSIQNENRCFANGVGSFDIVIKNLSRMKERYPDYYNICMTNTVLAPNQDFGCVQGFLLNDDVMKGLIIRLSLISDTGTNEVFKYEERLVLEQRREELNQMLIMLGEIDDKWRSTLFGDFENELYKKYLSLSSSSFHSKKGHPGGPCIAGAKKTFVDVNGDIYPCEKLPELEEMKLGNIETGFLYDKADKMINIARITEQQCKNCWAFIFCFSCVAFSVDEKGISKEKRLRKCAGVKRAALNSLKDIMRLQEYGYSFDIPK
jgi:uncharacterized protein